MRSQTTPEKFWDKRERYQMTQMTPHRYEEISSMQPIKKLFTMKGKQWKENRQQIDYVDIGCSDCKGAKEFASFIEKTSRIQVRTTGLDASDKCEVSCRKRGIDFLKIDLNSQAIPLRDIQIFTLFETIEHVFETDFLLQSIRKAISQNGILLVTTLNVVSLKNRILVLFGIQPLNTEVSTQKLTYGYRFKYLKQKMEVWKPAGHIRPFTLHSLCELIEDNGFRIISCYGLENWRMLKFLEVVAKSMCTGILVVAQPV